MAEEIVRDGKARVMENRREMTLERIDYNCRVGIPRDLIRAYGLRLA